MLEQLIIERKKVFSGLRTNGVNGEKKIRENDYKSLVSSSSSSSGWRSAGTNNL